LDDERRDWVGEDEIQKLPRCSEGRLSSHREKGGSRMAASDAHRSRPTTRRNGFCGMMTPAEECDSSEAPPSEPQLRRRREIGA
jgi:hypothetical protein